MLNFISDNRIPQPTLRFYKLDSGKQLPDIWKIIESGIWKKMIPENYESNVRHGVLKRNLWKPVIDMLIPLYPGMLWSHESNCLTDYFFRPTEKEVDMKEFLHRAEYFFMGFSGRKLGVQLSGGLDSSLISGLLRYFNIPFTLVGMTTNRYEFRTENYIQHLLSEGKEETVMLNYEQHLPFSDLELVPAHQYPNLTSINYSSDHAMAMECKRLGIEVLLAGTGGDVVFATPVPVQSYECTWRPQVFTDTWIADLIYAPCGVELVSFYSWHPIMDCIFNLRRGMEEDLPKRWARFFFRDFLPKELVQYTYYADFWGLYIDGLNNALRNILNIHSRVESLSGHPYFSEKNFKNILKGDLLQCDKCLYQQIEARTTLAVWINALNKTN